MKKLVYPFIFIGIVVIFFWKFIISGLLPIASDTIIGLYHPYRDYYAADYPNGIPYKNFLITDPVRQQYPWRYVAIDQMKQGELPVWNPYSFSGTPLLANLQSAAFYPLNILLFILPFHLGWSVLVLLQPLLGGLFMYLYLREMRLTQHASLLGSLAFALSGFSVAWLTWNTLVHVGLWLPLILYLKEKIIKLLVEKKLAVKPLVTYAALLIGAECSYMLAGHAQTALYVFIISNIYLFARIGQEIKRHVKISAAIIKKSIILFSATAGIIGLIVSFQYVPFFDFVSRSDRTYDDALLLQEGWFIPYKHLVQFVAPDFFGNPATLNYWGTWNYGELVGYVGMLPLILASIALVMRRDKKTIFFAACALVSIIFATDNPLSRLPYILQIPLLSTSQPTRLLFITDFSLAVLSALGLDFLVKQRLSRKQILVSLIPVTLFVGFIGEAVLLKKNLFDSHNWTADFVVAQRNFLLPMLLFITALVLIGILHFVYSQKRKHVQKILLWIIIGVTVADLFRFGWKFTPFTPKEYLYPETPTIQFLKNQPGKFRILATDSKILPPNFSGMYGIESVAGYDPLYTRDYAELASAWSRGKPDNTLINFNRIITPTEYESKIADMLGVKYILSLDTLSSDKLTLVFEEGTTKIYENKQALPRVYIAESVITTRDKQDTLTKFFDNSVDLSKAAFIESETVSVSHEKISPEEYATLAEYSPHYISIETHTVGDRLIVLTDAFHPRWHVYVDGQIKSVLRVNYMLRGVVVPGGTHNVEFKII